MLTKLGDTSSSRDQSMTATTSAGSTLRSSAAA
jgi:hypothetical protein